MSGLNYDLAIIGGGINGAAIARDASGRGLKVLLLEKGDLAGATSSAATKLIHGGLRYLEHYKFRLVREALIEREVLLRQAPHIIWPLRFVLPHHEGLRPAWMLRLGLFLYDNLGGREILPGTATLDLRSDPAGLPLARNYRRGFEYSDCWVEDSRLVILNCMAAREAGADIFTREEVVSARRAEGNWALRTGSGRDFSARLLINAAGPWAAEALSEVIGVNSTERVRLVKGSHIVVRKLFDHGKCYIFQNRDGRIIFAIPYETDFTLIGTTDLDYEGDPGGARISGEERAYLCAAASEYFKQPVLDSDVVWTYSGVRPLYDDGASAAQEATRDYVLTLDAPDGAPALVNIFGGKLTTARKLAEAALAKFGPALPESFHAKGGWTALAALPGGDFPHDGFDALVEELSSRAPWLPAGTSRRFARAYGTRAFNLIEGRQSLAAMGRDFGGGLTEAEVDYLRREEWAVAADDILWRRSKLGLRLSADEAAALKGVLGG